MGCCGEPANVPNPQGGNRSIALDPAKTIAQQPTPQPTLQWQDKPSFQPPSIATPPPIVQHQQRITAQTWPQHSIQSDSYAAGLGRTPSPSAATPTLVNASVNSHGIPTSASPPLGQSYDPSLTQMSATYSPSANMTITTKRTASPGGQPFAPVTDEGKLSVSIDFGTYRQAFLIS